MPFGEWMREKRLSSRLTSTECAKRAGISLTVWSRWENGKVQRKGDLRSMPRTETLEAVARGLGVSVAEVTEAAGFVFGAEMDLRLARRLEPILMLLPPDRRLRAEDALEQMARALVNAAA